ncbi:MAG: hypothetical protein HRU20_02945 [Pseudomonadales bacterium]|nr:hypothetical protein [Pseudomonadales bacterium]
MNQLLKIHSKYNRHIKYALAVPVLLVSISAASEVKWSGFATIAGGQTTSSDETYDLGFGNAYDDRYSFNPDSLFGLQASAPLSDSAMATAQVISRGSDDWNTAFEWAYLAFDVTDNWRLLLGRQRNPAGLYSDFTDVSYAYHWLRAPTEIYSPSFDSYDGIGSLYNFSFGEVENLLHVLVGRSKDNPFGDNITDLDLYNHWIAAYTMTWNWLTARASYGERRLTVGVDDIDTPVSDANDIDPAFVALTDSVMVFEDKGDFSTVSLRVDFDSVFVVTEFNNSNLGDNFLGESDSWYVSAGWRIAEWTVHLTYAASENKVDNADEIAAANAVVAALGGPVFTLEADAAAAAGAAGLAFSTSPEAAAVGGLAAHDAAVLGGDAAAQGAAAAAAVTAASGAAGADAAAAFVAAAGPTIATYTVAATAAGTAAGASNGQESDTESITVGARWDFSASSAFQIEYTSVSDNLDSTGDVGLFSAGIVAVF